MLNIQIIEYFPKYKCDQMDIRVRLMLTQVNKLAINIKPFGTYYSKAFTLKKVAIVKRQVKDGF